MVALGGFDPKGTEQSDVTTLQDAGVELRSRPVRARHMEVSSNPEPSYQNNWGRSRTKYTI